MANSGWLGLGRTAHRAGRAAPALWPVNEILLSHRARLLTTKAENEVDHSDGKLGWVIVPPAERCRELMRGRTTFPTGTAQTTRNRQSRTGNPKSRTKGHVHLHPSQKLPHTDPTSLLSIYTTDTRRLAHALKPAHAADPPRWLHRLLKWRCLSAPTLATWNHLLSCRGRLPYVLETLGLLDAAGAARRTDVPCPDWLFLALPGLLRSKEEAPYLVGLLLGDRFGAMKGQEQGVFVGRCVQHLLGAKHYVAAEEVVDWFVNKWGLVSSLDSATAGRKRRAPRPHAELQPWHKNRWRGRAQTQAFARVLMALTTHRLRPGSYHAPPPALLFGLAAKLRAAMVARQLPTSMAMFLPLFAPSLVPTVPRDAALLLLEMHTAGLTPPDSCLHAVMKVYAAAGDTNGASRIWNELEGRRALHAAGTDGDSGELGRVDLRWATTRLRALGGEPGGLGVARAFFDELKEQYGTQLDLVSWTELLRLVAMQKNLPAAVLVDVFDQFEAGVLQHGHAGVPPKPGLRSYTVLLQGLVRRGEHDKALEYWDHFLDNNQRPDAVILGLVARAVAETSADGPARADAFLRAWAYRPGIDASANQLTRQGGRRGRKRGLLDPDHRSPPSESAEHSATRGHPNSVALDTVAVNAVLQAYARAGQYRKVFQLWGAMPGAYGCEPDMASLSVLLDAARFASARAGNGYGPGSESLEGKLEGRAGADTSDVWEGRPAWKVAEGVMWDVLERNWPGAGVEDPLRGAKQHAGTAAGGEGPAGSGGSGIRAWLADKLISPPSPTGSTAVTAFSATLSPFSPPLYPHLHPTLPVFRSFIQLLGYHSAPRKVLAVLGWMKRLGVVPDRKLATLGLMYVGEVGLTDAELGRARAWCGEWLGEAAVPAEAEVAWMRSGGRRAR